MTLSLDIIRKTEPMGKYKYLFKFSRNKPNIHKNKYERNYWLWRTSTSDKFKTIIKKCFYDFAVLCELARGDQ